MAERHAGECLNAEPACPFNRIVTRVLDEVGHVIVLEHQRLIQETQDGGAHHTNSDSDKDVQIEEIGASADPAESANDRLSYVRPDTSMAHCFLREQAPSPAATSFCDVVPATQPDHAHEHVTFAASLPSFFQADVSRSNSSVTAIEPPALNVPPEAPLDSPALLVNGADIPPNLKRRPTFAEIECSVDVATSVDRNMDSRGSQNSCESMVRTISDMSAPRNSFEARYQVLSAWDPHSTRQTLTARRLTHTLGKTGTNLATSLLILEESEEDPDPEKPEAQRRGCDRLKPLIVEPSQTWRLLWDFCSCLLIFYECIVLPLQFIDLDYETPFFLVTGWFVRIFWTLDFPLNFVTAYEIADGTYERTPWLVARHYLHSWFGLDLPMLLTDWAEVVMGSLALASAARLGKTAKTLRLARMMRVARLVKVVKIPSALESLIEEVVSPDILPVVFNMMRVVAIFAWMNHVLACAWYGIGRGNYGKMNWIKGHQFEPESTEFIYLAAYHWSLQLFAGSAEIWPWNLTERLFSVVVGIITFVFAAVFVSSLTSTMTHFEILHSQDSKRLTQLKNWLFASGISGAVAVRVTRNARHALKEEKRKIAEASIELLPLISQPLRMELHFDMHMEAFAFHPFFRLYNELSNEVMRHVCHRAASTLHLSRADTLFVEGEAPAAPRVYFLKSGSCIYRHVSGHREILDRGNWIAEGGLWTTWIHSGTLVAMSECSFLVLDAQKFQASADQFQKAIVYPQSYAKEFVKQLNATPEGEVTDLEDPEMDIEWLAMSTCPLALNQNHGLVSKLLGRQSWAVSVTEGATVKNLALKSSVDLSRPEIRKMGNAIGGRSRSSMGSTRSSKPPESASFLPFASGSLSAFPSFSASSSPRAKRNAK